ncbi:hypothetical protein GQR58_028199 [Nymphon striatum]|nr:hypothetical protein GQR58_028199 [Nymphon striatum]
MVTGFDNDSAAQKQGIMLFDIVLSYNEQPLMHPKELIQLIRNDKIGRVAYLEVLRKGVISTIPVKLGTQYYPLNEEQHWIQYNLQIVLRTRVTVQVEARGGNIQVDGIEFELKHLDFHIPSENTLAAGLQAAQTDTERNLSYLGLAIDRVPTTVITHFPEEAKGANGVIVTRLDDYSPAADDGIKLYDVLLAYDDQPINRVDNFIKRISNDPAAAEKPRAASVPVNPAASPLNIAGQPMFPMRKKRKKEAWGDERHIWPDFYTDSTNDMWNDMINAPFKMGRMPGGWRAPFLSTPDPVSIGDAVTNQIPPIMEEAGNMTNFSD